MSEGTYLGLGEMMKELEYLRQKVKLQEQMIIALCAPKPDALMVNVIADEISALEESYKK